MNGVLQTAPAVTVLANGIRIDGISVPAGGVATLAYTARVNAFADPSAEGTIENTVTVTGGSLTEAVTAVETLPAATEPDLRITKALEPVQVSDSGTLTYTFTIENYGSIRIRLDNGREKADVLLDSPDKGLIVEHYMWREMIWEKKDSVLCVAADSYYDESDYIRDYDEFLEAVKGKDLD